MIQADKEVTDEQWSDGGEEVVFLETWKEHAETRSRSMPDVYGRSSGRPAWLKGSEGRESARRWTGGEVRVGGR